MSYTYIQETENMYDITLTVSENDVRVYTVILAPDEDIDDHCQHLVDIHINKIQTPGELADIAKIAATEYQRNRVAEYPSIVDQLDILFHGGYEAWKEQIQEVKNKYPKI